MPPLGSVLQIESISGEQSQQQSTNVDQEATTTTETIATSISNTDQEEANKDADKDGVTIDALMSSNDTDTGKEDSRDDEPSTPTSPKMIFIERLMGMNIQRAPGQTFSPFIEDSIDDKANKTDSSDEDSSKEAGDVPWGYV